MAENVTLNTTLVFIEYFDPFLMGINLLYKQSDIIVISNAKAQAKTLHTQIFESHGLFGLHLWAYIASQLSDK